MDNLIKSFKESIFIEESKEKIEQILDIIEEPVDILSENPIVKAVPVVKSVSFLAKSCLAIRDRILIKNLIIFITSMNDGSIAREKLEKYKKKLDSNPKILNRDLEKILIIIEKETEQDKIKILAQLYKSYINEYIDWSKFKYFNQILNSFFLYDIIQLNYVFNKKILKGEDLKTYHSSLARLDSLGLIFYNGTYTGDGTGGRISELGEEFFKYGILNNGINLR